MNFVRIIMVEMTKSNEGQSERSNILRLPDSWSNWNLEMLVFEERGKPEYPEKNLSEQGREPTTNSTLIRRRRQDLNPGHIGGRRVLSPMHHPCFPRSSAPCGFLFSSRLLFFRDYGREFYFYLCIFYARWNIMLRYI